MRIAGEGKSLVAVAHLALLGVKRQEPAFRGITKERAVIKTALYIWNKSVTYRNPMNVADRENYARGGNFAGKRLEGME